MDKEKPLVDLTKQKERNDQTKPEERTIARTREYRGFDVNDNSYDEALKNTFVYANILANEHFEDIKMAILNEFKRIMQKIRILLGLDYSSCIQCKHIEIKTEEPNYIKLSCRKKSKHKPGRCLWFEEVES